MSAALFEMAVHMSMEVCSGGQEEREEFIRWYIETKGGTEFPLTIPASDGCAWLVNNTLFGN